MQLSPIDRTNWKGRAAALLLVWIGCVGVLVAAGTAIERSAAINRFDAGATAAAVAVRTNGSDTATRALTWLGAWPVLAVAVVVAAVVFGLRRGRWAGRRSPTWALIAVLVAVVGEEAAVRVAKTVVERGRPPVELRLMSASGRSFPSGHTANAFVWWGIGACLVTISLTSRGARLAAWSTVAVVGTVVAYSRVALGVHWTTDVLASTVFAFIWLAAVVSATCRPVWPSRTRRVDRSPEPGVTEVA